MRCLGRLNTELPSQVFVYGHLDCLCFSVLPIFISSYFCLSNLSSNSWFQNFWQRPAITQCNCDRKIVIMTLVIIVALVKKFIIQTQLPSHFLPLMRTSNSMSFGLPLLVTSCVYSNASSVFLQLSATLNLLAHIYCVTYTTSTIAATRGIICISNNMYK